ncbi:hypothetical protein [uncultured Cohaesibacter sp.]|uniref:hypothetical protein n=1 Tax=uncultured Cohaesibacter sp. TaxID=1002546 RepID=UPI0029C8E5F3|nr:hypothetical protein [uncultured Cohaesibacter sp.]
MRISSFGAIGLGLLVGLAIVFSNAHIAPLLAGHPSGGIYSALASIGVGMVVGCGLYGLAKRAEFFLPILIGGTAIALAAVLGVPRRVRALVAFVAALALGLLIGRPAFAAETYVIDTKPLVEMAMPWIEALVTGAITLVITYVATLIKKYVGVELDQRHRESLAQIVSSKLNQLILEQSTARVGSFQTRYQILETVAKYVGQRGPDIVKHFRFSPEELEQYVAGNFGETVYKLELGSYVPPQDPSGIRPTPADVRVGPAILSSQGRQGG